MTEIGRLALRVEGEWWNAYWAPRQDSMEGAQQLGSIRMNLVVDDPKVKEAFMSLMKLAFSSAVKGALGQEPGWQEPKTAPERERAGRA